MRLFFDLNVSQGAFTLSAAASGIEGVVGVVGPSGAGKSTLLLALAGIRPTQGTIHLDDTPLHSLPAHQRGVGLVFQDMRLFPHLDVAANLTFGAPAGLDDDLVRLLDLGPLLSRSPHGLSGGEARRVALGRTLHARPRVLLLDEPLVGLDADHRSRLLPYLAAAIAHLGQPTLWVSHRAEDVLAIADRLLVIEGGRLTGDGAPLDLLRGAAAAASRRHRIDNVLQVQGLVDDAEAGVAVGRWGGQAATLPLPRPFVGADRVLLGPHEVLLTVDPPGRTSARNVWPGEVIAVHDGPSPSLVLAMHDQQLIVDVTRATIAELDLHPGKQAWALVKTRALRWAGS